LVHGVRAACQQAHLEVAVPGVLGHVDREHEAQPPVEKAALDHVAAQEGPQRVCQRGPQPAPLAGAHAVERAPAGIAVHLVEGEEQNIKITYPADLDYARQVLSGKTISS